MKSTLLILFRNSVFFMLISGSALFMPALVIAGSPGVNIDDIIESAFPGSRITEQREDTWQGRPVTEIELKTAEGKDLEVIVSKQGEILEVEEESSLPLIGGSLTIGLGGQWESSFYKGEDSEFNPAPFLHYENGNFELQAYDGVSAMYSFFEFKGVYFAVKASYENEEGYDPEDSKYLAGMDELDDTFGAGIQIGKQMGQWSADLEVMQDVSGKHKGQEVTMQISRQIDIGKFKFRPGVSLAWISSKKVDYYYGVATHEVRADRPYYSPDSGFEAGVEFFFERELFHNFSLIGYVELTVPGGEIKDSPLVDDKDYLFGSVIGIVYKF